jgi:hypothetical protein
LKRAFLLHRVQPSFTKSGSAQAQSGIVVDDRESVIVSIRGGVIRNWVRIGTIALASYDARTFGTAGLRQIGGLGGCRTPRGAWAEKRCLSIRLESVV